MLDCKHNVKRTRERMRDAIVGSSAYAHISLKFNEESLETIVSSLVTSLTYEVVQVMGEHGDEIIAEVKRFMEINR